MVTKMVLTFPLAYLTLFRFLPDHRPLISLFLEHLLYYLFIYLFRLHCAVCGLLVSQGLNLGRGSKNAKSKPLDCQGIPLEHLLHKNCNCKFFLCSFDMYVSFLPVSCQFPTQGMSFSRTWELCLGNLNLKGDGNIISLSLWAGRSLT